MERFLKSMNGDYYISKDGLRGIVFVDSLELGNQKSNSLALSMKEVLKNKDSEIPNGFGMFLKNEQKELLYLKYKYDGNSLSLYNYYLSPENRKILTIIKINDLPIQSVIKRIKDYFGQNIDFDDIERILNYPNILREIGIIEDDYKITIEDNNKIFDVSLTNVSIELNSVLFFKKHEKNELIDKFKKIESGIAAKKSKNFKLNYAFDSACNLLKVLSELSIQNSDRELFYKVYCSMYELGDIKETNDNNIDWMIISSYFLLNEKNKKMLPQSYSKYLEEFPYWFQNCHFLDKNNIDTGIFGKDFYEKDVDINTHIRELEIMENNIGITNCLQSDYYKDLRARGVLKLKYSNLPGCNEFLMVNGKLDYSKLFDSIRNSFAHSSYEIIDENNVRIYGFDPETNELNYNVIVTKKLIKKLINDYEYYSAMNHFFPIIGMDLDSSYAINIDGLKDKEELKEYLKSKKIVDLKDIKFNDDFDFSSYQYYFNMIQENIGVDGYSLFTSTNQILHLFNNLKKYVDFELEERKLTEEEIENIINEVEKIGPKFYNHGFSNKNLIIANIYRTKKLGTNNLNNAFLKIMDTKDKTFSKLIDTLDNIPTEIYDLSNYLEIIIISYLNNILLYSYNENSNIDISEIDLSISMNVDKEILKQKKINRINQLNQEIKNKRDEKIKTAEQLLLTKKRINNKQFLEKAPEIVIEKEKEKLKQLEQVLKEWDEEKNNKKINELEQELNELKKLVLEIDNDTFDINNYILEHLRNSLAHGNIDFPNGLDINNISDTEIVFKDYHPKTGSITFLGSIRLKDLIISLSNNKYLRSIYIDNNHFKK